MMTGYFFHEKCWFNMYSAAILAKAIHLHSCQHFTQHQPLTSCCRDGGYNTHHQNGILFVFQMSIVSPLNVWTLLSMRTVHLPFVFFSLCVNFGSLCAQNIKYVMDFIGGWNKPKHLAFLFVSRIWVYPGYMCIYLCACASQRRWRRGKAKDPC